jgi:hypothetical protein
MTAISDVTRKPGITSNAGTTRMTRSGHWVAGRAAPPRNRNYGKQAVAEMGITKVLNPTFIE